MRAKHPQHGRLKMYKINIQETEQVFIILNNASEIDKKQFIIDSFIHQIAKNFMRAKHPQHGQLKKYKINICTGNRTGFHNS